LKFSPGLELWGGVECTVNRVHGEYFEQLKRTGHDDRIEDLDLFAKLGIKSLRTPVLWERVARRSLSSPDFRWSDERLARLKELGIRPTVGLLHHGSGPRYTGLTDPEFPEKFAQNARLVAERYPEVDAYTPVNEILTTARFSGLYGFWYPHGKDDVTFARILMNEVRGTVLAMREIRKINPGARLIQTDDLGKTHSTPPLRYQAEFENERRWLGHELLAGRIHAAHPMYEYLRRYGDIPEKELAWHQENSCPPDVVGINYYLSGERYLHDRLDLFPQELHGGNHRDRYVDVLAARVRYEGLTGIEALLREAHDRLGLPLAITELHNGCTREEQMRWFVDVWRGAERAKAAGVDVRAVTAWSLLGAYDWHRLVTTEENRYEPGVYDIRSPQPRATAIVAVAKSLGRGEEPTHPVLESPGWWERDQRFIYGSATKDSGVVLPVTALKRRDFQRSAQPILITGGRGTLGRAFARICEGRGLEHRLLTREGIDIADRDSVLSAIERYSPWAIINTAGYVRVDEAEREQERCWRENVIGPATLAAACAQNGIALVTYSSDLVFDGTKAEAYVESDAPQPLNIYGASKAAAEREVLSRLPNALIIRASAFFGPWDEHNFLVHAFRSLAAGQTYRAAHDATVSPTYVPHLVHQTLDLLTDGEYGIWHLASAGKTSWFEFARTAAQKWGLDESLVIPCDRSEFPAAMPMNSALSSERAWTMPTLEHALASFLRESEYLPSAEETTKAA
jgi:dTDP-4-dehydrorhamnose reductase